MGCGLRDGRSGGPPVGGVADPARYVLRSTSAMSDNFDLPPLPDWVEALMPRAPEPVEPASSADLPLAEQASSSTATPPMLPVQSSNIAAVGHDGQALYVQFRNGGTYRYGTVGIDVHAALLASKSPGAYFHQHIKSMHHGEKMS